jgi:hypothetical protein
MFLPVILGGAGIGGNRVAPESFVAPATGLSAGA